MKRDFISAVCFCDGEAFEIFPVKLLRPLKTELLDSASFTWINPLGFVLWCYSQGEAITDKQSDECC